MPHLPVTSEQSRETLDKLAKLPRRTLALQKASSASHGSFPAPVLGMGVSQGGWIRAGPGRCCELEGKSRRWWRVVEQQQEGPALGSL